MINANDAINDALILTTDEEIDYLPRRSEKEGSYVPRRSERDAETQERWDREEVLEQIEALEKQLEEGRENYEAFLKENPDANPDWYERVGATAIKDRLHYLEDELYGPVIPEFGSDIDY